MALTAASASASEPTWLPSNTELSATNVGGLTSEPTLVKLGEEERFSDEPKSAQASPISKLAVSISESGNLPSCVRSLLCSVCSWWAGVSGEGLGVWPLGMWACLLCFFFLFTATTSSSDIPGNREGREGGRERKNRSWVW